MADKEIWKPIEGFPGYDVSSHGRVRSYWRRGRRWPTVHPIADTPRRFLKQQTTCKGYRKVHIGIKNSRKSVFVHKLVTAAFLGLRPDGLQINHRNGDKVDNRVENLEYVTPAENARHAQEVLGTFVLPPVHRGEDQHNSTLTEKEVLEIRYRYAAGKVLQRELAQEFNVRAPQICEIVTGKAWKHVKGPITASYRQTLSR